MKYRIEYFNTVFNQSYSIECEDENDALEKAKSISSLFEIKDVRLYELKEIEII